MRINFWKYSILILLVYLSFVESMHAQAPNWLWAKRVGGANYDDARSVKVDAAGNVYVAGWFWSSTITFGSITLTNSGVSDIYIVKYDSSGNVLWARNAVGSSDEEVHSIAIDGSGNVYVAGYFQSSTITFGSITLTRAGIVYNMFIAKYDASGNVLWANNAGGGGPSNIDDATSVATDYAGNIYVAGYFESSSITFGSTILTRSGSGDIFIAKYDMLGNVLWAIRAGGNKGERVNSISVDPSGNIYAGGAFTSSSISFGSTTLTNTDITGQANDLFIVKYDANGNALWAKSAGGSWSSYTSSSIANSLVADEYGNVYITGTYGIFGITFDGSTTLTSSGGSDMFIAKYDASGLIWAKRAGGTSGDAAKSIAVDVAGNVYVLGYYSSSSITFGTMTFTNSDPAVNSADLFIVKYNAGGSVIWAKKAGGILDDLPFSISTDPTGNIYAVGYFMSPFITFGCTTLTNVDQTGNYADVFIVKVNSGVNAVTAYISANGPTTICNGSSVDLTANSGSNYLWSNGETTQSISAFASGNYSVSMNNANGCAAVSNTTTIKVNYCSFEITIKAFIEGFYQGSNVMNAAIDPVNYPLLCDTFILQLASPTYPYNILYGDTSVFDIYGNGTFQFNTTPEHDSYYLVLSHRNSIKTWSSSPVMINTLVSDYKFTTSINKAYGNNLKNLGDGNFGIYSGDTNQDGIVESQDYSDLENAVSIVLTGYVPEDITGDGIVESTDYSLLENNVYYIISSIYP